MGMHYRDNEEKFTIGMIIAGIIIIAILLTSLIVYLLNVNSTKINEGVIEKEDIAKKIESSDDFEDVSMDIGKSVNEAIDEMTPNNSIDNNKTSNTAQNDTNITNTSSVNNTKNNTDNNTVSTSVKDNKEKINKEKENTLAETNSNLSSNTKKEDEEEIKFVEPVKGEIIREFAPESLVYSETLKEWITHNGVDIKADKASVVVSACDGKVSAINNDPRYGLTVIIEHNDGYKTVYSNLLTAEFVVEGEEVKAGQTIGTIGNSANFEIADDYHLHFELIKDGKYIDPVSIF
ncbi:MAG TPA: M23 family peptidase [Clostridiales bacterium]|nr:M23 family peptidase [Clostridiales bacterium]